MDGTDTPGQDKTDDQWGQQIGELRAAVTVAVRGDQFEKYASLVCGFVAKTWDETGRGPTWGEVAAGLELDRYFPMPTGMPQSMRTAWQRQIGRAMMPTLRTRRAVIYSRRPRSLRCAPSRLPDAGSVR